MLFNTTKRTAMSSSAKRFLIIDGSYYVFHRFFAVVNWYQLHNPLKVFEADAVFSDEEFMGKYNRLFGENVMRLMKRHRISSKDDVLFVEDCPRQQIWRNASFDEYKKSRKPSTINPHMFHHSLRTLAPELGVRVLAYPEAEADDVAYVVSTHLASAGHMVTVITNDNDYLQMIEEGKIEVYNLPGSDLSSRMKDMTPADYLKYKILVGDKSDNIPSAIPKVGPKRALDLVRDPAKLERMLDSNPEHRARYEKNNLLMNFEMIPESMRSGVLAAYEKVMSVQNT